MGFLSKLRGHFQIRLRHERRKTHDVEASASEDSTCTENLAQSLQNSPFRTSSVPDSCLCRDNETPTPAANQPNDTNLPPLSNSRELELVKFRQEIDEWKKWKEDHPDQNWIRTVKDLVDEKLPLLEVLPDGMIPIRGMVKSLIYTCTKAADFVLAKEEVFLFMQEVDGWLDIVSYAFNSGGTVEFGIQAWKVLDEIRQLIRAALEWSSGLVPSRWLSVQSQIQVYRTEFTEISERFGLIFDIRLAEGLDGVNHKLESFDLGLKMLSETGNTNKRLEFLKQRLQPRSITNASYNDQNKPPCDPDTRGKILQEIKSWINDLSEESQCFYWLSGAPGVGKSAITASVAKDCQDSKVLGSQFFINRNDAATTDPRALFPTICWQLCECFPQTVAVAMEKILYDKPSVIDEISDDQVMQLFVKAIEAAGNQNESRAVVIVIDALDETDPKPLWSLAQILAKVLPGLPRYAKVFISSRAEDAITRPFNPLCHHTRVKSRYLAPKESIEEVSLFMKKNVNEILRRYDINWANWGDDRMEKLSSQASGLYIWAKTALKFLQTEIENSGTASCVGELLNLLTANGMDDINQLYLGILQKTCKNLHGDWERERFHRIIGAIIVLQAPLSIADITQLLALKDPVFSTPVDLVHFVRQYRSVLVNDTNDINDGVVPSVHRSFADFITSERAKEFHVDKCASHGELALQCIEQLNDLVEYLGLDKKTKISFPAQLVYVSVHWQTHLTRMVEPDMNYDTEEKNAYDMPDVPESGIRSLLANPPNKILDRAEKAWNWRGFWSLAFSPDGTQFAIAYGSNIQIRDARTGSKTMSLNGHDDDVRSVGFSSDGKQLVSASHDSTARIWTVRTGRMQHVLRGHTDRVRYAGFSHDGRTVVTGSDDWTLCTWDSRTGQQLKEFEGHEGTVTCCKFSQNDQCIASCSHNEIMVWDVNLGNLISKLKHKDCYMVSFCPCGYHLMSHDRNQKVVLWIVKSGEQLNSTSTHIHVPPTAHIPTLPPLEINSDSLTTPIFECVCSIGTPFIHTLETPFGPVYGIVEHGQPEGVWGSHFHHQKLQFGDLQLFFDAGATRILG